jgi:hypothetical protein
MFQPKILDEYSDPFDLKKLNSEQSDYTEATSIPAVITGAAASALSDTADATEQLIISEDDYSVPYEVKTHALGDVILFIAFEFSIILVL